MPTLILRPIKGGWEIAPNGGAEGYLIRCYGPGSKRRAIQRMREANR